MQLKNRGELGLYINTVYALFVFTLTITSTIYTMNPIVPRPLMAASNNGVTQFFHIFITVGDFSSENFEKYHHRQNNVSHIICHHFCHCICISFAYGWLHDVRGRRTTSTTL